MEGKKRSSLIEWKPDPKDDVVSWRGKWVRIDFFSKSKSGKTDVYKVATVRALLGYIKWHGPWRSYAFFPETGTLYQEDCLIDITKFLCELWLLRHKRSKHV